MALDGLKHGKKLGNSQGKGICHPEKSFSSASRVFYHIAQPC